MTDITVTVTATEYKCLEYVAVDPQEWSENAVKNRARKAKNKIIALLTAHCNANSITLATGEDAQITQAFDLGVVEKAVDVGSDSDV